MCNTFEKDATFMASYTVMSTDTPDATTWLGTVSIAIFAQPGLCLVLLYIAPFMHFKLGIVNSGNTLTHLYGMLRNYHY